MADGKLKKYLVSGELIVSFNIEVDAENEEDAEEQVSDMAMCDLADNSEFEDLNIGYVECLDEEDDDDN